MADYNFEKTPIGFDVDKMDTDTHLLLEQYHIFSKTPAAPTTALGGARNKAGHTTTSSDIWSQEIPAFFKAYSNDDLTRFATLAKKNDLVLLAYTKSETEPNGAVLKFVNGVWTKIHNSIASIPDGTGFYNSVDDTKPVIRFHRNSAAVILSGDNNNTDGSNGFSAKICSWNDEAGAPYPASALKFVPQFVSPMDKMINGIPSSGYDAIVKVGTTEDDILAESPSSPAGYIANNYAGIIHFNTARSDGDIYVHAFEYIGDKLDSSLSAHQDKLDELDDKLGKISMTAAGGLQGVSDTAKEAGLTEKWVKLVDGKEVEVEEGTEGGYPVVDITTAEFKDGIFVDNDDNKTKLVTAQDVTAFVNNHVKENSVKTISINDTVEGNQLAESFVADENNNISLGEGIDKVYNINRLFPDVRLTYQYAHNQPGGKLYDIDYDTVENGEKVWDDVCALTYLRYYFYVQDLEKFGCGPDEIYAAQNTATPKTDKNGNPLTIKDTISYQKMQGGLTVKYFRPVYGKSVEQQGNWATRFFRGTKTRKMTYNTYDDEGNVTGTYSTYINPINWTWRPYHDTTTKEIKHECIRTGTDVVCNEETGECSIVGIGPQAQPTWREAGFDAFCNPGKGWDLIINGAELDEYNSEVSASGIKVVQAENLLDSVTVTPATYTPATAEVAGSWNDDANVTTGAEVAKAIADVNNKIATLHSTAVTYKVFATKPTAAAEYKGIIALVPATSGDSAVAGDYVEWLCVETVGEGGTKSYSWEQIGTTAANLTQYAKSVTVNGTKKSVTTATGDINIGKVASSVADGTVTGSITDAGVLSLTVDTEALVSNGAIKTSVTDANALVKAGDALAAIKLAKPENYIESVTGYTDKGAEVTTTQGVEIKILDSRGTSVTPDDLWGTKVTLDASGNITVTDNYIANWSKSPDYEFGWFDDSSITTVENNKVYAGDTFKANVQIDKVKAAYNMFASSSLTSFNGDLSNLIDGSYMFSYCKNLTSFDSDLTNLTYADSMFEYTTALNSFDSDLPSLRSGYGMFASSTLTSFNSDLSNLIKGEAMFYRCKKLISFNGDLNNLADGTNMFEGTGLTSFDSDLSSLTNGYHMFASSSLTSFNSDLSNLVSGLAMFQSTDLTSFNGDLNNLVNGEFMFNDSDLTSFNGDLSSLVNGAYMFYNSSLTSFNGDLSSLVVGTDMFKNTSLNIDSVETICDVLPNWKENKIMTNSYNEGTNKIISSEWDASHYYYYYTRTASGVILCAYVDPGNVKTITIKWSDISVLTEAEKQKVLDLMVETANEKGWTFITNSQIDPDGKVSPTQVMTTDGTVQHYTYVIKVGADEKTAKFVDANGEYWNVDTAECIIGPNVKYWELFATKEDAITAWGLSEYTYVEPTEEVESTEEA